MGESIIDDTILKEAALNKEVLVLVPDLLLIYVATSESSLSNFWASLNL